jgi:hypothetical protein
LRDRYLEQFNSGLVLPQGKYDVSRSSTSSVESQIEAPACALAASAPLLIEQSAPARAA